MSYCLSNDTLTLEFTSLGGALTSIKNKEGLEYLWQGDATYWSGQAPVLFPICGSLRNNTAQTLDGRRVRMPRHGLIRKLEFVCEKQTENEIIFSLESSQELRKEYPYDFKFFIQYLLIDQHITVQYLVLNRSQKDMPFFVGGHPGFNCPLESHLDFSDYQIRFEQQEKCDLPDNDLETGLVNRLQTRRLDFDGQTLPLDHSLFQKDALIFANSQSKRARLFSPKGQHGLEIYYPDFSNFLIWSTANHGPFVALEPMEGLSTYLDEDNFFEHKENLQLLAANDMALYQYRLTFF